MRECRRGLLRLRHAPSPSAAAAHPRDRLRRPGWRHPDARRGRLRRASDRPARTRRAELPEDHARGARAGAVRCRRRRSGAAPRRPSRACTHEARRARAVAPRRRVRLESESEPRRTAVVREALPGTAPCRRRADRAGRISTSWRWRHADLHSSETILTEIAAVYEIAELEWRPYLYHWLGRETEPAERAAIEAGELPAIGYRFTGRASTSRLARDRATHRHPGDRRTV